jgi:hypothetical protein
MDGCTIPVGEIEGRFEDGEERRQWPRSTSSPDEDLAIVLSAGGFPNPCNVVDEGKGGICVCLESDDAPVSGDVVRIVYRGRRRQGHIRHVARLGDSQWKVGIAWAIPSDDIRLAN